MSVDITASIGNSEDDQSICESPELKAIEDGKIYTIIGTYNTIRKSLCKRGWIDNTRINGILRFNSDETIEHMHLKTKKPKFIWKPRNYPYQLESIQKPIMNRIIRTREFDFTLKDGLKNCVDNMHWHLTDSMDTIALPRTYVLQDKETIELFLEDFKLTKIIGFLIFLNTDPDVFSTFFSKTGTVSTDCIHYSLKYVEQTLALLEHFDIDFAEPDKQDNVLKYQHKFNKMTSDYVQLMELKKKMKYDENYALEELQYKISEVLKKSFEVWPDRKYEDSKNFWILKPVAMCEARGINIMNNQSDIMNFVRKNFGRNYLVQKYIERPLLIYNSKFDIRQYFLTFFMGDRLTLWMYKNCYLKFSSREFNFRNFDKSVHITNHTVQKHYKQKNSFLPDEKMWLLKEFRTHLKGAGCEHIWDEKIYRGMKNQIMGIVLASLEGTTATENTFELNGADFLIGYDYEPIFLEVNSSPDLSFSTKVTEEICRKVMEDAIKVTIDYHNNPDAETGDFEKILDIEVPQIANEYQADVMVIGKKIDNN